MTPPSDHVLPGILLTVGYCLIAPLLDVSAKLAAAELPVGEIATARFVIQAALVMPVVLALGYRVRMSPREALLLTARALANFLASFAFITAIRVMPLADALAIVFVEPFLLMALGHVLFAEAVGRRRLAAAAAGFAGALMVIQPSFATFGWVALMPLLTAVFFALYILLTRALTRTMHPVPLQGLTALVAAAIAVPVLWAFSGGPAPDLDPIWPRGVFWAYLAGVGIAATLAHLAITFALRIAPTATLAPLQYLELIATTGYGFLVFGNFPDLIRWLGIGVISTAGLYVILIERRGARAPAPAPE